MQIALSAIMRRMDGFEEHMKRMEKKIDFLSGDVLPASYYG